MPSICRIRWGGDLRADSGEPSVSLIYLDDSNPFISPHSDLAAHRNRCYVFGLNNTFSLDATYAGNISRFIDHSDAGRSKRVNSQARGISLTFFFPMQTNFTL